jgi:hypothetical protein
MIDPAADLNRELKDADISTGSREVNLEIRAVNLSGGRASGKGSEFLDFPRFLLNEDLYIEFRFLAG